MLTGWPGIGKTTLWEAGVDEAPVAGLRVLSARPSDAEAKLVFGALIDVFDRVGADELEAAPAPQLEALEVALLRRMATGVPHRRTRSRVGLLNALRALSERDRVLVALDDIQWLDAASASALAFAARRLEGDRVRFLLARRPGTASALEQALEPSGNLRLELGGLSLGGMRRLLLERLGLSLSRPVMRRIFDSTLGNPLFALEVGRTLVVDGVPAFGAELPVPERVEELLGTRVAALPGPARVLTAVALSPDLRLDRLAGLATRVRSRRRSSRRDRRRRRPRARVSPADRRGRGRDCPAPERRRLHRVVADPPGR